MQPEMSAYGVTEKVLDCIEKEMYDVIILNYANCDMVGHTGDFDATVKAVKTVDECVGKVTEKILAKGGVVLITADHGNADDMWNETEGIVTAHSTNPVPFIIAGEGDLTLKDGGKLADICPTMLDLMGIEKPSAMTGESLIQK